MRRQIRALRDELVRRRHPVVPTVASGPVLGQADLARLPMKDFPPASAHPASRPVVRVAAFDPPSGRYYAVEIRGDWTGELVSADGSTVGLELHPVPVLSPGQENSRVYRSLRPVEPNFVIRGEYERNP